MQKVLPCLWLLLFLAPVCCSSKLEEPPDSVRRKFGQEHISWSRYGFLDQVERGNAKNVEIFLQHGMDPEIYIRQDSSGLVFLDRPEDYQVKKADYRRIHERPLSLAAEHGRLQVVRLLLAHGAKVDNTDGHSGGKTALHYAAENGHAEIVEALLAHGADIDRTAGSSDFSALMYAAEQGHLDVVKALVKHGAALELRRSDSSATPSAEAESGQTALMLAAHNWHLEVVKFLAASGADINARKTDGQTALIEAVSTRKRSRIAKSKQVIIGLLNAGAAIDATDREWGWTPLMFAAREGKADIVKLLLSRGAGTKLEDKDGKTALSIAEANGQTEVVTLLSSRKGGSAK